MHRCRVNILSKVLVTCTSTLGSYSSTSLLTEFGQWGTLNIAQMAYRNNHRIIWIEILWIKLVVIRLDHGTTIITVFLLHLVELIFHHLLAKLRIVQDLVQIVDGLHQLIKLIVQLFQTESCQLRQTHVNDGLALKFIKLETLLQVALRIRRSFALTDNVNHLINIVTGNDQTFEYMSAFLCLFQIKLSATNGYIMTMLYEILHTFLQGKQARSTIDQSNAVDRERTL